MESVAFFKATYKEANISKPEEANGLTEIRVYTEPKSVRLAETPAPAVSLAATRLHQEGVNVATE